MWNVALFIVMGRAKASAGQIQDARMLLRHALMPVESPPCATSADPGEFLCLSCLLWAMLSCSRVAKQKNAEHARRYFERAHFVCEERLTRTRAQGK